MSATGSGNAAGTEQALEAVFSRFNELEQRGELDEAERVLRECFGAEPAHPHAIHLGGVLAFRRGRSAEAVRLMERSLALTPERALYSRNLCELYRRIGRLDDAAVAGARAVRLTPDDAESHVNLALVHYDRGDLQAALASADAALKLAPDMAGAHFERAKALLADGRLSEGWEEYEWRFRLPGVKPLLPSGDGQAWDGRPLQQDTLLLIADQGYGDAIQFSRYIPWVLQRCNNVVIASSPELLPLMRSFPGPRAVGSTWQEAGTFKFYCALSGLPRLHGTSLDNIPATPYLHASPARVAHWRARLDALVPSGYRRIAIAWAGRPTHKNDSTRSVRLQSFAPVARLPGVALLSMQKGEGANQIGSYFGHAPLINCGPELHDFEETAALIEACDLVLTVDTSVGHLAGALGKPAWLLLAQSGDWRWLLEREDTPWYPQHRLFRQRSGGGWPEVFERVAAALTGAAA